MASLFQNNTAFTNVIKFTACPGNCLDLYSNVKRNVASTGQTQFSSVYIKYKVRTSKSKPIDNVQHVQ